MNDLERRLLYSGTLPMLPPVARRMLERAGDDEADPNGVADLIAGDPWLAEKLLALINSPTLTEGRQIETLRDAVLFLGTNSVRCCVLSLAYIRALRVGPGPLDPLWRTSLMNALASYRLASETGGWDPYEAFMTGLVSDCGVLLMADALHEYGGVMSRFRAGEAELTDLERAAIDTDHMRVGALLLESWGFPQATRELVAAHHDPSRIAAGSPCELHVRVLAASWLCARALSVPGFMIEVPSLDACVAKQLGLPSYLAHAIVSELADDLRDTAELFELDTSAAKSFEQLLSDANEALAELAAHTESAGENAAAVSRDAESVRRELSESLRTDEASGLLCRQSFDALLDAHHRRARQTRSPLGLMIVEISDLKELAAREAGHADELMRGVGARIDEKLRGTDQAARFATDQIAVLMPGCSAANLQSAAERVRLAIEERPIPAGDDAIDCPVVIGIASSSPHQDALDPRALVTLASSAVDRAQASPERIVLAG